MYYINVVYKYDDITINYRHHNSPDTIAEIFVPGEGHITVKIPVSKLINILILNKFDIDGIKINDVRSRRFNNLKWFYDIGGNWLSYGYIQHPYISAQPGSYGNHYHNPDYKYVCVGNMDDEIRACVKSLDFISLKIFIDRIMTHFDTNTGPLNRIHQSYYGQPKFLVDNDEYYSIIPMQNTSECRYLTSDEDDVDPEWIREESYCAKYCSAKKICDTYKMYSKDITKEEVERKALEQATINAARRIQ